MFSMISSYSKKNVERLLWLKELAFRHKRIATGLIGIALLLTGIISYRIITNNAAPDDTQDRAERQVEILSVLESSTGALPLPLIGRVSSESEATLRSETTRRVTRVSATVGDYVTAGTVLVEFENASERANYAQADAALDQTRAQLKKVAGGQRSEELTVLQLTEASAAQSVENSKSALLTTLLDAYADANDAIIRQADALVIDATRNVPRISFLTSDSDARNTIENTRAQLTSIIERQENARANLSVRSDLETEAAQTIAELRAIKNYLDALASALQKGIPGNGYTADDLAAHLTTTTTSRSSILADSTALSSANGALLSAENALSIATTNKQKGESGERTEDVSSAEASVKQAEAAVALAAANLEKTRIRTPISGTLNTLTVQSGDFASAFDLIAVISNNNALQVVSAITAEDLASVSVGSKVRINDAYDGVVTSIAPGLDPVTRKAEIRVGLLTEAPLTHGASASLVVYRDRKATTESATIRIPLSALKLRADGTFVFFVTSDNRLVARKITVGKISDNLVEVREGLALSDSIVRDARGLSDGDLITQAE